MIMAWLRRLFRREATPLPANGHAEALEREQARLVARLEALQIRVDVQRRVGDDARGQEAGREIAGR